MSTSSKHGRTRAGIALVLALPVLAQAQSSLVDAPWYVGLSAGGVAPENLREVSPGANARLLVGIPLRPQASLEANIFGLSLPGKNGFEDERTGGAGLDLRLESLGQRVDYLFVVGGGYSQARRDGVKISAPYANIGWGLELDLGSAWALRSELRGLVRFSDELVLGRGVSYDALLNAGVVYRFGKPAVQTRAAPAAAPAPSLPPAPAISAAALPPVAPPVAPLPPPPDFSGGCPLAPAGFQTDSEGCLVAQKLTIPRAQLFEGESASLRPDASQTLMALAAALRRQPALRVDLTVHTDTLGTQAYNLDLTTRMADQLRESLVNMGVAGRQIQASGAGEVLPIANEIDDAGRAQNRRINIRLY